MTLVLDKVSKKVGAETWIRDVSLTLERGSLNVLLGPTLSGKTSLMRLMAGLDAPSSGRVLVEGKDVTGWPVQRRSVAMVYQQFINYPSLERLREHRLARCGSRGFPRRKSRAGCGRPRGCCKLEPYLDRKPLNLSGGQQQRTAIARALVKRADLVLLDEPLANLDYKLREELARGTAAGFRGVRRHLRLRDDGAHGGAAARRQHRDPLARDALTQFGPTPSVYRQPHDLITAQVFSDPPLNLLTARKSGDVVSLSTGGEARGRRRVRGGAGRGVHGRLSRPPSRPRTARDSDALAIPGIVSVSEITGSETYLHVDAGERRFVALVPGVKRLEPGAVRDALSRCRATFSCSTRPIGSWRPILPKRREGDMARITLDHLAHAYGPDPKGPQDYALKEIDHVWEQGGAYALLGPSGCGKTTLLNIISGLVRPSRGPHPVRRTGCHRPSDGGAQHRAGVPVPGRLRHHDGAREPRVPAEEPACAGRPDRCPRRGDRAPARSHARPRPQGPQPHRRHEAEDLARTRARALRRGGDPVRRAADGHRSASEMAASLDPEGNPPAPRHHHDLRDARPDRGADLRRQGRGHA